LLKVLWRKPFLDYIKTNPHHKVCKNIKEIEDFYKHWEKEKDKLDYGLDGIVIKVNSIKIFFI
jgi:NAD-dependent DNA ligase